MWRLQMDEIEHRQLLERGTVSLPALRDFRQELRKGTAWQPESMRASGAGDLASWRRPGAAASEEPPVGCCCSDRPVWACSAVPFHAYTDKTMRPH